MDLTRARLKRLMRGAKIRSLSELARKAGIHRNSLHASIPVFHPLYLAVCGALGVEPLDLVESHSPDIRSAVSDCPPHLGFFLYGSRAKGSAREFSDYDVGVTGGARKLDWRDFLAIKETIARRCDDLPVKVSLLNFDDAPESFLLDFSSPIEFLGGSKEAVVFFMGYLDGRKKAA